MFFWHLCLYGIVHSIGTDKKHGREVGNKGAAGCSDRVVDLTLFLRLQTTVVVLDCLLLSSAHVVIHVILYKERGATNNK